MCGLSLKRDWLITGYTHKENWLFLSQKLPVSCQWLPSYGWDFMPTSTLHAEILSGLSLQSSCTCHNNCFWVRVCHCPAMSRKHYFLVVVYHLWLLQSFLTLLPKWSLTLERRGCDVDLHLGVSTLQSFILCSLTGCLCVNHHLLQKEVSLMRVEKCTHLWV